MNKRLLVIVLAAAGSATLVGPTSAGASITGLPEINPNPTATPPLALPPATAAPAPPAAGVLAPTIGASWAGISDPTVTPPDTNGAIGPHSYVEIINLQIAIYDRTGGLINSNSLERLTGHPQFNLADPMALWDPNTQRFYYNVWDAVHQTMAWGFSKDSNPTTIPGSFCNYTSSFGYAETEATDYPKLGQTKNFLLIGVNHYPNFTAMHADRSDVLWIDKPQGNAPVTNCPAASRFGSGKFTNVRNQDGTQAWTPVPAIQDDPSSKGYVVTSSDIECPDICGTGNKITVHTVTPSASNPRIPTMTVTGRSFTVPTFAPPATKVPQKGSVWTLDPLDGRLEHAVSAIDPALNKVVIWTGHSVNSVGDRTEFRWYEILPTPNKRPTLVSSGVIKDPSLYVFNGAVAPDRTVNPSGAAHGNAIVIGFSTSSSSTFPAAQMVSKIGSGPTSPFVLVHQSTSADSDFSCKAPGHLDTCRWGDYGGATSDPAQSLTAPHGKVWLTNESVTDGLNTTWNWEAMP